MLRGINRTDTGGIVRYEHVEFIADETPSGAVNGINTVFTLANTPADATLVQLYRNGLLQILGGLFDYTIAGSTITFVVAPLIGSRIRASYWSTLNS